MADILWAASQERVPHPPSCAEEHASPADEQRQRERLVPNRRKLFCAFHTRRYPSYQHEDFQWRLHEMCTMERNSRPEYHRNEVFKVNHQFIHILCIHPVEKILHFLVGSVLALPRDLGAQNLTVEVALTDFELGIPQPCRANVTSKTLGSNDESPECMGLGRGSEV